MPNSRRSHIEYDPPPKPHFLTIIALVIIAVLIVVAVMALIRTNDERTSRLNFPGRDRLPREVSLDKVLRTRFFNVMVDTVMVFDSILDRGAAVNLPWEEGNQYLVINISFKNTDNESKMVPDGTLEIDRGNYELKYDSPETLVQRGWGSLLQDIEPGITKKTRIVYKIPSSTTGKVYYYPDAANNGDRIFLLQL